VDLTTQTTVSAIEQDLAHVVGAIVRPLYERFGGFYPSDAMIARQVADFERDSDEFR
jgi:hypothetical protein